MVNTTPEYAAAHGRLHGILLELAPFVGTPTVPVLPKPEEGSPEYVALNSALEALKKAVYDADIATDMQRNGKFTNIEIGNRANKNGNSNGIDAELFASARSYRNLFERYKGSAPIFGRKYDIDRADTKINHRASNDFMGEIVDDKTAFTVGQAVSYKSSDAAQDAYLSSFLSYNNMPAFDSDTMTMATAVGVAYRYYWMDEYNLKATLLPSWDVIYLDFESTVISIILSVKKGIKYADIFMNYMYVRVSLGESKDYTIKYNLLGQPVIAFPNNPLWASDVSKVVEMLDAYDLTLADIINETAQLRTSYLNIQGGLELEGDNEVVAGIDQNGLPITGMRDPVRQFNEAVKQSAVIHTPAGTSVGFVSKTLQIDQITKLLDTIENNIYRFTKSVNNSTKSGGDQPTAFSLKQRLTALRNKCMTSWLAFNDANKRQWQLLAQFVNLRFAVPFDPELVTATPKLNIPIDMKEEIDNAIRLSTILPLKYALKQLSIFEDDEALEAALVEIERDGMTQLEDETEADDENKPVSGFTGE